MNEEILDSLVPSDKTNRHNQLLNQLRELDDVVEQNNSQAFTVSSSPSWLNNASSDTYYSGGKKKKKKKEEPEESLDDWTKHLIEASTVTFDKKKNRKNFILNENGEFVKKKKKKKSKEGEPTDFKKEFSTEMALYSALLRDQSALVDTLQKNFNSMISTKGSSRGITKVTTDLIDNITSARATAMQLVDKTVALKKTCYELAAKERKEKGLGEGDNLSDYAGVLLKQMISSRGEILNVQNYEVEEMDNEKMDAALDDISSDIKIEEDVDKYLKYENQNVTIYACVNPNDISDYEFIAEDMDGVEILDYPLPPHTKLSVNRSTEMATDAYGSKYHIRWK